MIANSLPDAVTSFMGGGGIFIASFIWEVIISFLARDTAEPKSNIISITIPPSWPVITDALVHTAATVIKLMSGPTVGDACGHPGCPLVISLTPTISLNMA